MKILLPLMLSAALALAPAVKAKAQSSEADKVAYLTTCGMLAYMAGKTALVDRYSTLLAPYAQTYAVDIAYNMGRAEGSVVGMAIATGNSVTSVASRTFDKVCANEEM